MAFRFIVQDGVIGYSCYPFWFKGGFHLNSVEADSCCLAGKPGIDQLFGLRLLPLNVAESLDFFHEKGYHKFVDYEIAR